MKKVSLLKYFRAYVDSSHHIAAIHMLERALPDELLDKDCDWVVCFEAEDEVDPRPARYTI